MTIYIGRNQVEIRSLAPLVCFVTIWCKQFQGLSPSKQNGRGSTTNSAGVTKRRSQVDIFLIVNCHSSWNWSTKSLSSPSLLVLFPQLFHFLFTVLCACSYLFEDFDWRLSQFPQFNFFSLFVFILCYPVITLPVLCACLHFIMMTMLVFCYVYLWVLIPLLVVLL